MPWRSSRWMLLLVTILGASLALVTVSGCWSRRELDTTGFVLGFGVDALLDDSVVLTVQTALPSLLSSGGEGGGGGGGSSPIWVGSAQGPTLFDAMRSLNSRSSNSLFWAHARALVVSESVARRGLRPILDFLARQPQIRPSVFLLVTPDNPKDVLSLTSPQEKIPISYLTGLLDHANLQGRVIPVNLQEFLVALTGYEREPIAPGVALFQEPPPVRLPTGKGAPKSATASPGGKSGDQGGGESGSGEGGGEGASGGGEQKKPDQLSVQGTAVFRRDKLIGWLSPVQTSGLRWVMGLMNSTPLTVHYPNAEQQVAVEIVRANTRVSVEPDVENPARSRFTIAISGEGNIQEVASYHGPAKYVPPMALTKVLNREVTKLVHETVAKMQKKYRSDIFGFGEHYREAVPGQVWERVGPHWAEYFPDVPVTVRAHLAIRRRGMILTP